jgi:hypothetical protein
VSLSNKNGIKAPSSRGKQDLKDLSRRKKITGRNHHHRTVCVRANLTRVIKRHHRTNRTRLRPFFFFRAQFFRGPDGAREKAKRKCAQNLPLFCKIFAVKPPLKEEENARIHFRKNKTFDHLREQYSNARTIDTRNIDTYPREKSQTNRVAHLLTFMMMCSYNQQSQKSSEEENVKSERKLIF